MNKIESIIVKINRAIIDKKDIESVVKVLKSGFLSRPSGGPMVRKFQRQTGKQLGQKHAFAVTSGTAALHLAISSLELKKGDEVIIPALANVADLSVVFSEGAKVVFADIDPQTFNIDPRDLARKITDKTKAVIVVHMYGLPADMDKIRKVTRKHGIVVIEDCAQAAGARYRNKYVGSFGDISCFSFYQTKHIITGEGGMVLTVKDRYAKIIDSVANNGIKKDRVNDYDYDRIGYNYQMSEIQAALGLSQISKLGRTVKQRQRHANLYRKFLKSCALTFQAVPHHSTNSYFYLTGLLPEEMTDQRDKFIADIQASGVPIKKLYPISLAEIEFMKKRERNACPVATALTKRLFNLYVNPGLSDSDIRTFTGTIKKTYRKFENEIK